jgi:hypothetical protein
MGDDLEERIQNERERRANQMNRTIAEELTPQGDLLPPWLKFPEIQAGSIGWRMGYGEIYMMAWDKWSDQFSKEQLIGYFKKYLPIPLDWLPWVSNRFGDTNVAHEFFKGGGDFDGIHWLEQQGLANFDEFKSWYDSWYATWKKQKDRKK